MLDAISFIFTAVWRFFTDVEVPGLGVPFSALLIAVILVRLSVTLVSSGLGFGNSSGTSTRSASTRNAKISDARKGDEF